MEYNDIIPQGLENKTEEERQEIVERWEHLHDLRQVILDGEFPEAEGKLPEIEKELASLSKLLEPRESPPDTGVLHKDGVSYVLCPRCGTFVQVAKERINELALEFKETPDETGEKEKFLIRSITCSVCKWGLGVPE